MKAALYFLGCCFLVWAAAIWWVVTLLLGAVDDVKAVVANAPVVIEKAQAVVVEFKEATAELAGQVDKVKAAVPHVRMPSPHVLERLKADGLGYIRSYSFGDAEAPAVADTPDSK